MKLLFDQNISFRLIKRIIDVYPESRQVRELGLENATDFEIFEYAKKNDYAIVTFDSDFCDLNIIKGFPPKIIWLRDCYEITYPFRLVLLPFFFVAKVLNKLWLFATFTS